MTSQPERLKARARLALRAERAFGLTALPLAASRIETLDRPTDPPPLPEAHEPDGPLPVAVGAELISPPLIHAPEPRADAFSTAPLSRDEKIARLIAMEANEVRGCRRCRLCEGRTHTVFGEGSADAKIFFIGEGPGQTEDETGRPFVGRAGELLNKMIAAMGLRREDVYIANCVKCRPPQNRTPMSDEVATCAPYLERQIEIVRPQVIVTLGLPATQHMLQLKRSMSSMRGQWHAWRGIKVMPTFHPAYLLRSYTKQNREMVWSDLRAVMTELELSASNEAEA